MGLTIRQSNLITAALYNPYSAFAKQTLTMLLGATANLTVPEGARYALVAVEGLTTSTIRIWSTGDAATADSGFLIGTGGAFDITGMDDITRTSIYAKENCTLQIQYYK